MHLLKLKPMLSTALRFTPHLPPPLNHRFRSFSSPSSTHYPPLHNHEQWSGLQQWRHSPLNHDRFWGPNGPIQETNEIEFSPSSLLPFSLCSSLAEMGSAVLSTADPLAKAKLSHFAYTKWREEGLPIGVSNAPIKPARPPKPQLVGPKEIPSPKSSGLPLNAYMLHNLAHIELNAIDLAWDTVVRFSPYIELLGEGFVADFAHVADDESRHFTWCSQRLAELGFSYGDMPAHSLLWRECDRTSDSVAARLAVIPMVQEARGLDAGPRLVSKLTGFGDLRTSNIVSKIADEEVAHVAVGVYWFVSVCQKMDRLPGSTFKDLLEEYNVELKGPFNHMAREEAGLPLEWYDPLPAKKEDGSNNLSEVYERLGCIISMEQENSSLGK